MRQTRSKWVAQATSDELLAYSCISAFQKALVKQMRLSEKSGFYPPSVVAELIVFPISDTLVFIPSVIYQNISHISVIRKTMKSLYLFLYYDYAILQFIPMQPMPGYKIGYALRRRCVKRILGNRCGKKVVVKDHCDFGNGARLTVGDNSKMGRTLRYWELLQLEKTFLWGRTSSSWQPAILVAEPLSRIPSRTIASSGVSQPNC